MTLQLAYDAAVSMRNAKGVRISCLEGALWITLDGDPADTIVEPGQSFRVDRAGTAVVLALRDSRVMLLPAPRVQLSVIFSSRISLPNFS